MCPAGQRKTRDVSNVKPNDKPEKPTETPAENPKDESQKKADQTEPEAPEAKKVDEGTFNVRSVSVSLCICVICS